MSANSLGFPSSVVLTMISKFLDWFHGKSDREVQDKKRRDPKPTRILKTIFLGESGVGKTSLVRRIAEDKFTACHKATIGCSFRTKTVFCGNSEQLLKRAVAFFLCWKQARARKKRKGLNVISKDVVKLICKRIMTTHDPEDDIDGSRRQITFQLWDTSGQERFQCLGTVYYRAADAIFLCFDITKRESLERLSYWLSELDGRLTSRDWNILVCGCKSDLSSSSREVSNAEAVEFCCRMVELFPHLDNLEYIEVSAKNNEGVTEALSKLMKGYLKFEKSNMEKDKLACTPPEMGL